MIERAVTVVNELGLHARAAARFVHLATRFESQIRVGRNSRVMDGKSIMGILLLAAARGTTLTISAQGADEDAAVAALAELVASGFGESSSPLGPGLSAVPGPGDKWNGSRE
jgi:phosphocarrier protein